MKILSKSLDSENIPHNTEFGKSIYNIEDFLSYEFAIFSSNFTIGRFYARSIYCKPETKFLVEGTVASQLFPL